MIHSLGDHIASVSNRRSRTLLLVAVNGQWGVGKTTLLDKLVGEVASRNMSTVVVKRDWFIRDREQRKKEREGFERGEIPELPDDTRMDEFRALRGILIDFAASSTAVRLEIQLDGLYQESTGTLARKETVILERNMVAFVETGYSVDDADDASLFDLCMYALDDAQSRYQRIQSRYDRSTVFGRPERFDDLFARNLKKFNDRLERGLLRADIFVYMNGFRCPFLVDAAESRSCAALTQYLRAEGLLNKVMGTRSNTI